MQFHPNTVQTRANTRLGPVRLAASPAGLCGLWFEDQRHLPQRELLGAAAWPQAPAHPLLRQAALQLQQYLDGTRSAFDLPLDLSAGTPFQQQVWRALLAIGRGGTTSYGALARQLGRPQAVRALGAAVGRNPLSMVVPCHRVLGAGGSLTGLRRRPGAQGRAAGARQCAPGAGRRVCCSRRSPSPLCLKAKQGPA